MDLYDITDEEVTEAKAVTAPRPEVRGFCSEFMPRLLLQASPVRDGQC